MLHVYIVRICEHMSQMCTTYLDVRVCVVHARGSLVIAGMFICVQLTKSHSAVCKSEGVDPTDGSGVTTT
jgi:hypothetical protein